MMAKENDPEQFGGVCGVVAELIRTDSDYELAVEVALGSAIQNVVTETAEDAKKGITFLKKTRAGRVTFLPLNMLRARSFRDEALLNQTGVIGLASDLVEYAPKYDIAIRQLLGNTVVIKDLDTAIQLATKFSPKFPSRNCRGRDYQYFWSGYRWFQCQSDDRVSESTKRIGRFTNKDR